MDIEAKTPVSEAATGYAGGEIGFTRNRSIIIEVPINSKTFVEGRDVQVEQGNREIVKKNITP